MASWKQVFSVILLMSLASFCSEIKPDSAEILHSDTAQSGDLNASSEDLQRLNPIVRDAETPVPDISTINVSRFEENGSFVHNLSEESTPSRELVASVTAILNTVDSESSLFNKWVIDFFPRTWPNISTRERFLRIVGIEQELVCTHPPDSLDYSVGWQQRSILYLYQSNKTRIHCNPYNHTNVSQLEVVEGHLLQDYLNETVGNQWCTVVFFFSGTCPYCRRAAPLMHSAAVYFPTLRFLAINTDRSPGVAGHYGILGVPVVVLFDEKKFLTGWTIPYPDARDTIRAFIMAYTDVKYIPQTQNITGLEEGIIQHFDLEKHPDLMYMVANIIVLTSFVLFFWKNYLYGLLKRSLDQAGVDEQRFIRGVQQPHPQGELQIPVPQ